MIFFPCNGKSELSAAIILVLKVKRSFRNHYADQYADLTQQIFLIRVVVLNIFVETMIHFFSRYFENTKINKLKQCHLLSLLVNLICLAE